MRAVDVRNRKLLSLQRRTGPQPFFATLVTNYFRYGQRQGWTLPYRYMAYTNEAHAQRDVETWAKAGIELHIEARPKGYFI